MSNHPHGQPPQVPARNPLEEAEALIWGLLDDQLSDAERQRLSEMIAESAPVRARYLDCVQLHVDLTAHFAAKPASPGVAPAVLPNLLAPGFPAMPGFATAGE